MNRRPMQVTVDMIMERARLTGPFAVARILGKNFHVKVESPQTGFMPLTIENVPGQGVSVAHYYEQEGDLMRDPEIVFNSAWHAIEYTQDNLGLYQEAEEGHYIRGANSFAHGMWSRNLRAQGFTGPDATVTSLTHYRDVDGVWKEAP